MKKRFQIAIASSLLLSASFVSAAPVGSIEERIQRLERMADNPVLLQLSQRLAQQEREIQGLHDTIDRLKRDQRMFLDQAKQRYAETDQRISQLEAQLKQSAVVPSMTAPVAAVGGAGTATVPVASTESKASGVQAIIVHPATAEENAEYQKAFALMRAANYQESIKAFEAFIKKSPDSSLASNASYWAGEGYLILKNYDQALVSFERIIEQYPDSGKKPDAMLRAGDSLTNLKKTAEANKLYQQLIKDYPDTRAAKNAEKRINP
ncbi:tol-pal system protein YbgF [Thiomicrorhabdus sp.]|uniref:tol-pal system protein YbgF n=1 Tax=Thiomicrorhabdus sp. TaxID=2039724 RepID=UPI00356AD440